jgi:tRNA (mo5U34)-methyltransferase
MPDLREQVAALGPWYQNIQLSPEVSTNPSLATHPLERWQAISPFVPADLTGATVLDIGCNAGFFSVALKQRGAERVVGIDIMPHVLRQARFVADHFKVEIDFRHLSVYDVASLGSFDLVLCVGVLYHLRHPLYALDQINAVCRDLFIAQTVIRGDVGDFVSAPDYADDDHRRFDHPAFPKMYFIEHAANGDASNWWFATRSCFTAMLRSAGFDHIQPTSALDTVVSRRVRRPPAV